MGGRRNDHDRLFKLLIQTFFKEFMELFFPDAAASMNLSDVRFLSQELLGGMPRVKTRRIDLLVETALKGEPSAVYVHIETQAHREKEFAERMFMYFCRLYNKYRSRILPIAVMSHRAGAGTPSVFAVSFPFAEVLRYEFLKVELRSENWRLYIRRDNPVAAALLSVMGYAKKERVLVKREFLRMLVRLRIDWDKMKLIAVFFETYLKLNEKEEKQLKKELERLDVREAEAIYELETTWERRGRELGRTEGKHEGKLEGKIEGSMEKERELIRAMHAEGVTVETIAKITKWTAEDIIRLVGEGRNH